jgi:hypothetical protein
MNPTDEKLWRQITYPQHNKGSYVIESYVPPGSKRRTYRVLLKLGGYHVVGSYIYLKNAVACLNRYYEEERLEASQATIARSGESFASNEPISNSICAGQAEGEVPAQPILPGVSPKEVDS